MTAFNVVRFKVKAGMEEQFLDAHRQFQPHFSGFRKGYVIQTGDHAYCFIGEWDSAAHSLAAEKEMVTLLDQFRDTLEDQGPGVGITDPVVGDVLISYRD
ncbi:hypothetical protein [Sedimenticola sp.]|uniref:hypothetical protein n=1 Tax=Sedimenticola sp. TaxID=1940285 RepID=UPI003D136A59